MTALKKYTRLESTGLWRAVASEQRREVYVSFGKTSLIIRDKNDNPLSHWSLPAVIRMNPGGKPAIFTPKLDSGETIEIDDETMIEAIEQVRSAINRRRPHPGRLRLVGTLGIAAAFALALILWLPGALARHAVGTVPFETRQLIGRDVLTQIARLTGPVCSSVAGDRALKHLAKRLFGGAPGRILILAGGTAKSAMLPGRVILLNRELVENYDQPEVAASYALIEDIYAKHADPLARLLTQSGPLSAFRLLTTGRIDPAHLAEYARVILTGKTPQPDDKTLLDAFEKAGFSSAPLAYQLDMTGEESLSLIEADPFRNRPYAPVLSDADWVSLQGICGA